MGNEQSNTNKDTFNRFMQQQIINQTNNNQQVSTSNSDSTTKNIRLYNKKQREIQNIQRKQERLRQKEEELQRREQMLMRQRQQQQLLRQRQQRQQRQQQQRQQQQQAQKTRQQFNAYQQTREQEFQKEINELQSVQINPFQIFNIPENFTLEQLKKEYKRLALRYHPDRPNGDELKFKIITKVYLALFEKYKTSQPDKQFTDLRNGSRDYIQHQNNNRRENIHLKQMTETDKFNLSLFNKIYDEHRLFSSNDDGYDKWLKDDSTGQQKSKLFSKSFNINVFNTFFNKERENYAKNREIVEYKDPESQGTSMNYGNLGEDKVSDFTSGHNSDVHYSDIKRDYTDTFLVPTEDITRPQFKNINHIKSQRSNINYVMSDNDKARQTLINQRLENEEQLRLGRVKQNDRVIENHHNKMNKMFLGFR